MPRRILLFSPSIPSATASNERGEMQTGLQSLKQADGSFASYYFGDDGVMRTGKQTILQ